MTDGTAVCPAGCGFSVEFSSGDVECIEHALINGLMIPGGCPTCGADRPFDVAIDHDAHHSI